MKVIDAFHHKGVSDSLFEYLMNNRQYILQCRGSCTTRPNHFDYYTCKGCCIHYAVMSRYIRKNDLTSTKLHGCSGIINYVYDVTCMLYPEDVFEELL